ncbi:codanin-1 isoform X1 [Melanaphis sacchari]|uniref:Codanin-1 n=1 Tax=Melanaphis sacchari TaxID=742174 RepID=A0A2H8U1J4_9HEMI|nr:codanin-1 isoform X1 [Melanaphis sacchari]XP_025191925.1 codanin-1 isoform X1 [Melanaphis sacchari]
MQKYMSKSEVRCASLMNNVLEENIDINEILEKIKSFEQCNIRHGVGKIEFTFYVIDFIHNKTMQFVNQPDENEPVINNVFNVPEVESPMVKRIIPKVSTTKCSNSQGKKTVQIRTVTSKMNKTKISDSTKKERRSLDILGNLYAAMINSNILCNLFHELGYVFTLLTVKNHEIKSNNDSFSSNNMYFKSSDDCHYFAAKTIEQLVSILIYLEKPIINLILKQKVINTYAPELAKTYENKFNSLSTNDDIKSLNSSISKEMVKFDGEHDAKDCFPSLKMFYAFKTQRDTFYDLLENWKQNENQYELDPKKFENIKKMLNENSNSVNMSKFAKLFVAQLINSTFEESKNVYKNKTIKELSASKLELLHQRITKRDYTSGYNVNPANEFPGMQMFFKEFIIMLLDDGVFCKHLIDTLVHRIDVFNTMEWASELQEGAIYQQTFFFYIDTLKLLGKFLGFTLYYSYKDYDGLNPALKEYIWEIRSKVLPPINLLAKLRYALKCRLGEIVLTTSWIIEYLYQVDQISITTPFYKDILTLIYSLCMVNSDITAPKLMLRLQFNCLIEHINIEPHTLFDDSKRCFDKNLVENVVKELKNDLIVNTKQIYHYCPQLNNYRTVLESKVNNKKIKFLSPTVSLPNQKINQNRQIELELESHFFENHSPSVLATVDFIAKRIASSCTKKIQNQGIAAVKNQFVDIVCEKFKEHINENTDEEFKLDENDVAKCSLFLSSSIQQYVDHFSKKNIPNSIKELLDSESLNPGSLPFCIAVTVRKFKALVTDWVKNHINIKNMFITYISTELKTNLKNGSINEDGNNLRELLMPTQCDEPDEDMFIPENELLIDLNIFSLKIIEVDNHKLSSDDIAEYSEKFKIVLENKNKMESNLYRFIIARLIDNVLLATYQMPKLINKDVMKAYHPYLAENLYIVSMIICERNIYILSEKSNSHKAIISEKITAWIQYFIENNFLTIDELTDQIMSILQLSWPEDTLKCLSICFKDLNSVCLKKFDDAKVQDLFMWLTNFMDMIEDYDIDY